MSRRSADVERSPQPVRSERSRLRHAVAACGSPPVSAAAFVGRRDREIIGHATIRRRRDGAMQTSVAGPRVRGRSIGRRAASGARCRGAPLRRRGCRSRSVSRLRHPHPMHPSSFSRIASSIAIRSSSSGFQLRASFAQSRRFGVRDSGSEARADRISPRLSPTRCATFTKLTRLSTSARNRRCPAALRSEVTSPLAS